ncbi:MAG: SpoIIIAH-like family protein [Clostridia bacterium]|nr:SpoIIIAH-like family protein [Clostridia bacterium]
MTKLERKMRRFGCAALLLLLTLSAYSGAAKPEVQAVSVPVTVQTISQEALSAQSLAESADALAKKREALLAQLQSIADQPGADSETINQALRQMAALVQRMETEASVCTLLCSMGFSDVVAILSEERILSVIVPWQIAENEKNRLRIMDAVASHAGVSPDAVKIILAKK